MEVTETIKLATVGDWALLILSAELLRRPWLDLFRKDIRLEDGTLPDEHELCIDFSGPESFTYHGVLRVPSRADHEWASVAVPTFARELEAGFARCYASHREKALP